LRSNSKAKAKTYTGTELKIVTSGRRLRDGYDHHLTCDWIKQEPIDRPAAIVNRVTRIESSEDSQ
jgi:hypothetical protein